MKRITLLTLSLIASAAILPGQASAQIAQVQMRQPQNAQVMTEKDPQHFDTKLPVEITSDSLEVLQHENKAVFKGNVVAVQGKVRLKSDIMIVHYKQGGSEPKPATPAPAGSNSGMGAITLIEVQGHVLVATPEESAQGDKGDYDVPSRLLRLSGGNVVLTRGKNIMRGTDLVYNMDTGRSILTNQNGRTGSKFDNGGTRVRSLFVPNQDQQNSAPTDSPAKP
ncbi:MAG TPA: LptA/OstA family protein [Rickettsiales bacterium]|nr:LptA/OstA family protein [Rickettsiales bacterium]